jgi:hypothetical protein
MTVTALPMIANLGGCGDVINFGAVNFGHLKDGNLPFGEIYSSDYGVTALR